MSSLHFPDLQQFIDCPKEFWLAQQAETPRPRLPYPLAPELRQLAAQRIELNDQAPIWTNFGLWRATVDFIKPSPEAPNKVRLYFVRASGSVYSPKHGFKEKYLKEWAFSYHLFCLAGYEIEQCYAIWIDKDYRYPGGEIPPKRLLKIHPLGQELAELRTEIALLMQKAEALRLQKTPPKWDGQSFCKKKLACPFIQKYHGQEIPEFSIFQLPRHRLDRPPLDQALAQKKWDIKDLDPELLPERWLLQQQSAKTGQAQVDVPALKKWLAQLEFPLQALDYEAVNPAVPFIPNSRPFQHIPFQFSWQVWTNKETGDIVSTNFLAKDKKDPTPALMQALLESAQPQGSILVWHKTFERDRNRELAKRFPEHRDFLYSLNERLVDLEEIVTKGLYIDAKFEGRSSLKKVLPVLLPQMSYDELPIAEGLAAADAWWQLDQQPPQEQAQTRQALIDYCQLDTFSLIKMVQLLMRKFGQ